MIRETITENSILNELKVAKDGEEEEEDNDDKMMRLSLQKTFNLLFHHH